MKSVIALGNFDGVHKGHAEDINRACETARRHNARCVVYTFDTHPQNILTGSNIVKAITQNDIKEKLILSLGADCVFFEKTTREFLALSPGEFIDYLTKKFNPCGICTGYNYRFGKMGAGDTAALALLGREYGFETQVTEEIRIDGNEVSSSVIRRMLEDGEIAAANLLLTKEYAFGGKVVHGKHLGKTLGFPTANIYFPDNAVIPKSGVYKSHTVIDGKTYVSITNIGSNPTVENITPRSETFIRGFEGDIYDKEILVSLVGRIRDEKKFNSIGELTAQIKKDTDVAFQGGTYE